MSPYEFFLTFEGKFPTPKQFGISRDEFDELKAKYGNY